jgi:hypothetical protein
MRSTADVLASLNQQLYFYNDPNGGAFRIQEVRAVRAYETQLLYRLEDRIASGKYPVEEAKEAYEMLLDYRQVQSERYWPILRALADAAEIKTV